MKTRHYTLGLVLTPIALSSQDLVKNASFDVGGSEPTGWSQIDRTDGRTNGSEYDRLYTTIRYIQSKRE